MEEYKGSVSPESTPEEIYLLVERGARGDERAIEDLLSLYQPLLNRLTGNYYLRGGDAQDLKQEAEIAFAGALKNYDRSISPNFTGFISVCTSNRLKSLLSSYNSLKRKPLNDYISLDTYLDETHLGLYDCSNYGYIVNDPCDTLIIKELLSESEDFVNKNFSKKEAKAWNMYMKGYSYREIAESLGCSEKSIDNSLQRAKLKIYNNNNRALN